MIRRFCGAVLAALALTVGSPAYAERLWLLIGASDASAAAMAKKAKLLAAKTPAGLVMQTRDCGDPKNVFAWVGELAGSAEAAQAALPRVRQWAPDAYIKRCDAKPGSLLALRIDAIDPSIAEVPSDAVNWSERDRVSSVQSLADGRSVLVTRYFADIPNDPLEGRRERVSVIDASEQRTVLQEDCLDASRVSEQGGDLAFQCAREQAADELLHNVLVFDAAGRKLAEIARCRNPQWSGERSIACDAESVDADGRLKLQRKRTSLAVSPTLK